MARFERVAFLRDLWVGDKLGLNIDGRDVLVLNIDGEIHAYENRCPHLGLRLSDGTLCGSRLMCGGHHWEYEGTTGAGINPATVELKRLAVMVENDAIFIDVESL